MNCRIGCTLIDLISSSLKPTSTPTPTPVPAPVSPVPSTVTSGGGLTTVLLIIVSLALVGVITWILWMFRTQRWVSAKSFSTKRIINQTANVQGNNALHVSQQANQLPQAQAKSGSLAQQNFTPVKHSGEITAPDQVKLVPRIQPDDPLKNKAWLGLAEECVKLYDELDGLFPPSDPRQEAATHVMLRLQGLLARSGVEPIVHDRTYDMDRHLVVPPSLAVRPGTPIARIVSPGFAVGNRVIRPAQVQVGSKGGENMKKEKVDE